MKNNIFLFLLISVLYGSLNASDLLNKNLRPLLKRQVNPCQYVTCLNGGTCVANFNLAKCVCPIGFFGVKCQFTTTTLATRQCGNLTCLNGGVCVMTGITTMSCFCPPGFSGNSCELGTSIKVEECQPNTCLNNQPCKVLDGKPQCFCLGNFVEPNCASPLPPGVLTCTTNPCLNNGQCLNINGADQCLCIGPFTGARCETALRRKL